MCSKEKEVRSAFMKALEANEQQMGEVAAFHVTCEQLGIDPDDGYVLLADLADDEDE